MRKFQQNQTNQNLKKKLDFSRQKQLPRVHQDSNGHAELGR